MPATHIRGHNRSVALVIVRVRVGGGSSVSLVPRRDATGSLSVTEAKDRGMKCSHVPHFCQTAGL